MNQMTAIGRLWRCATGDGVPKRSLVIALIVGTILNAINQGDLLLAGMAPDIMKLLLTYLVPYCVSTYGAVSYRLHAARPTPKDPAPYPAPLSHENWPSNQEGGGGDGIRTHDTGLTV